jgi:protein tyrosine phosphatase
MLPCENVNADRVLQASTMVKLKVLGGDEATSYINANHVVGDPSWGINYIAAQGLWRDVTQSGDMAPHAWTFFRANSHVNSAR